MCARADQAGGGGGCLSEPRNLGHGWVLRDEARDGGSGLITQRGLERVGRCLPADSWQPSLIGKRLISSLSLPSISHHVSKDRWVASPAGHTSGCLGPWLGSRTPTFQ